MNNQAYARVYSRPAYVYNTYAAYQAMANKTPAELLGARYQQVLQRNQQAVRQMQAPRPAQRQAQVAPKPAQQVPQPQKAQTAHVQRREEIMEPKIEFTAKVPRPKGTTKSERTMIGVVAAIFFVWLIACSAYVISYVMSGM